MAQTELDKAAGISQRLVAYYELESAQPRGAARRFRARAQSVGDELLGLPPTAECINSKTDRLLKRLQRIEEFPPARSARRAQARRRHARHPPLRPTSRAKRKASLTTTRGG